MRKPCLYKIATFLLAFVLAMSPPTAYAKIWSESYGCDGAFDTDQDLTYSGYIARAGWNMTLAKDPPNPTEGGMWPALYGGDTVRWQNAYQTELFSDSRGNTAAYVWALDGAFSSTGTLGLPTPYGDSIAAIARSQVGVTYPIGGHYCQVPYVDFYLGGAPASYEGWDWCCIFVMWCAYQLGYVGRNANDVFCWTASCSTQLRYMRDTMGYDHITVKEAWAGGDEVMPGDIMLFNDGTTPACHIGIVVEVGENNSYIMTVEGNTNGGCDPTLSPGNSNYHRTAVHYQKYTSTTNYPAMQNGYIFRPNYPAMGGD